MRWNLRMKAAERGMWKSTELRRQLADAGLVISAGKMSGWWAGTPTTIRLEDLDVICTVLECSPAELLIPEPEKVAARRPGRSVAATAQTSTTPGPRAVSRDKPRPGRRRSRPPV